MNPLKAVMIFVVSLALVLVAGFGITMMQMVDQINNTEDAIDWLTGLGYALAAPGEVFEGLSPTTMFGSTALVISDDAPALAKTVGNAAHVLLGDRVAVCDDTADNVEIQAAIDALTAARTRKETVKLVGNFSIAAAVEVPSFTTLDIEEGYLELANGVDDNIIEVNNSAECVDILGGILDGNSAGQTPATNVDPIYIQPSASYVSIVGVTITDSIDNGIQLKQGVHHVTISDCDIYSNSSHGIEGFGTVGEPIYDIKITGNSIHDNTKQGISCHDYMLRVVVTDNDIASNTEVNISIVATCSEITIKGNTIRSSGANGISCAGTKVFITGGNHFLSNTFPGVTLASCTDVVVADNYFNGNGNGVDFNPSADYCLVINNIVDNSGDIWLRNTNSEHNTISYNELRNGSAIVDAGADSKVVGNYGYVAHGETRSVSGSLTAGNANAICFAWHDPELQDILVTKVVVEVTTAGGTPGSHLDVGIADDAAGTNRGTEFFDDLLLNSTQVNDSWVAGDGGTQTKWVFCQDSASGTDGWVVGQILDANAASLVGKYYIEYVGR